MGRARQAQPDTAHSATPTTTAPDESLCASTCTHQRRTDALGCRGACRQQNAITHTGKMTLAGRPALARPPHGGVSIATATHSPRTKAFAACSQHTGHLESRTRKHAVRGHLCSDSTPHRSPAPSHPRPYAPARSQKCRAPAQEGPAVVEEQQTTSRATFQWVRRRSVDVRTRTEAEPGRFERTQRTRKRRSTS